LWEDGGIVTKGTKQAPAGIRVGVLTALIDALARAEYFTPASQLLLDIPHNQLFHLHYGRYTEFFTEKTER
jgi:hypothetical protein